MCDRNRIGPVYDVIVDNTNPGYAWSLVTWYHLGWSQVVIGVEHFLRKFLHDWFGCEVNVAEYFIREPTPKDLYDVRVNFGN